MEDMKKTSASTEGNENTEFTFPCGGFEKISEMMGQFFRDEKRSFDCGEMMKKCYGGKKETFDFRRMMKRMCGPSSEKPARE
jgi:hypothetical protein